MRELWAWLRNSENRGIVALIIPVMLAAPPALVWLYGTMNPTVEEPRFADVCPPAQGDVAPEVASKAQVHATGLVLNAKSGTWPEAHDVRTIHHTVWSAHKDESEYEIRAHLLMNFCQQIFADTEMALEQKRSLNNLCYTALITENTAERLPELRDHVQKALATPQDRVVAGSKGPNPALISGGWRGKYFYRAGTELASLPAVDFQMRLSREDLALFGASVEPRTFNYAPSEVPELIATIHGSITGEGLVRLRKTYLGMAGASHNIVYEGSWNPKTGTIEGKWQSDTSPDWWGRFVMTKTEDPMQIPGIPL